MKAKNLHSVVLNLPTKTLLSKALLIFIYSVFFSTSMLFAQGYSKFYYPYSSYKFDNLESYLVQNFVPTTTNNFTGTIMVQRVEDSGAPSDPIQVTLVNQNGNVVSAFLVFGGEQGSFTPTCAAYNAQLKQYCIAGINEVTSLTNATKASWFLFLDQDLAVVNAVVGGMDMTSLSIGGDMNLFVTDIASVEGVQSPTGDFIFTGISGNTDDPSPTTNTTYEKQMCMGYVSATTTPNIGTTVSFDFGTQSVSNSYFPSRIIEVPMAAPDGGFIVTGTAPNGDIFFLRTDYSLTLSGTGISIPGVNNVNLYAGDLYFDKYESEVWFAGTGWLGSDHTSYIYQKLVDLTIPGITLYNNIDAGADRFAEMILPDNSFSKIAKIMPTNDAYIAAIAGNVFESPHYNTPNNSYTYPTLNKIKYLSSELDLFSITGTTQPTELYTYPRTIVGNYGVGNYLTYLSYGNLFYPSHNAHCSTPTEEYVMGSSSLDPNLTYPEMIALTRTDNYYENECSYTEEILIRSSFQYTDPGASPNVNTLVPIEDYPLQTISGITLMDPNDCENNDEFKQIKIQLQSLEKVFDALVSASSLIIKTEMKKVNYILYNSVGSIVKKGMEISSFEYQDVSSLSNGVYLIEVCDTNGNKLGVKKIIIN